MIKSSRLHSQKRRSSSSKVGPPGPLTLPNNASSFPAYIVAFPSCDVNDLHKRVFSKVCFVFVVINHKILVVVVQHEIFLSVNYEDAESYDVAE